jgi:thiamine pyrophosphokinase
METTYVIVGGGSPPNAGALAHVPPDRLVIVADSGLDHAERLGLAVDLVVGDLDSVTPEALHRAEAAGVPVERHPVDKDAIDLDLAIEAALQRGAQRILVLSGGGDRVDHVIAGQLLLAHPRLQDIDVEAWWGTAHLMALQGPGTAHLDGPAGTLVSAIPLHGDAEGITTKDLRFPLRSETLPAGSTRGISNELLGGPASIAVERGRLLIVVPYALGGES